MLERGELYSIKTKQNEIFKGVFLGSYYKVSSSKNNKTANKTYDFITKEGKFESRDYYSILKVNKLNEDISDNLKELISKYEDVYWKNLENIFLMSKIKKEAITLSNELNELSNQIKIANNHFTLKDLMNENWLLLDNVFPKFKSLQNEISLTCKFSKFIYHNEIDNCSLNCFELDINSLNDSIVKDVNYKIRDIKTANKLYDLKISNDLIDKLNKDMKYFTLSYNSDFNNLSITDKFVCMDNLLNIKFKNYEYSYDDYTEMKSDLNYCIETISEYLEEQLKEVKLLLTEVIDGVQQEKEYERQYYGLGLLDIFNFNMPNISFSKCYC